MHVPILAEKLISRGHTVHALVHPDGAISDETLLRAIPTQAISIGAYFNPLSSYLLIHFLRWFKPDIVLVVSERPDWRVRPSAGPADEPPVSLADAAAPAVR